MQNINLIIILFQLVSGRHPLRQKELSLAQKMSMNDLENKIICFITSDFAILISL